MKATVAPRLDWHTPLYLGHSTTPCVRKSRSQTLLVGIVECVAIDEQEKQYKDVIRVKA